MVLSVLPNAIFKLLRYKKQLFIHRNSSRKAHLDSKRLIFKRKRLYKEIMRKLAELPFWR